MTYIFDDTTLFVGVDWAGAPDYAAAVGVCGSCKTVICADIAERPDALALNMPGTCPKCGALFASVLWNRS